MAAPDADAYEAWIAAGMHANMSYLARNAPARRDIRAWFEPAQSILICAYSYGGATSAPQPGSGRLARYAVREDYHPILKEKMESLLAWLQREHSPGAQGRAFCDTSPLLERAYARISGLGWQGKNAMLINPRLGSYFLLAGLALDVKLPADEPTADHCGSCTRCLQACPTDAFPAPHVLDASRCISYFTIENKGPIPEPHRAQMGNWVFGCDVCQDVCPWNRFEKPGRALPPAQEALDVPLEELAGLDDAAFRARFAKLPVSRAKRRGLLRSALLAMGNSRLQRFKPILERWAQDGDELLAEQARWSLRRLLK